MHTTADRLEFAPPATRGLLRGLGLAILAHAFLVAALTWGVRWKQAPTTISAEAELWAAVPQQAAPPPPPPEPVATPAPLPPVQATPALPDPEIALEQERKRIQKEKQLLADRLEQDKRDKQRKLKEKQQALDKQRELEQQRELDKRLAADKQKAALEAKRKDDLKAQQEASKKLEAQRQANLQRMAGLARNTGVPSSTGAPSATGTAAQAAGPSAGYGSRVAAKVRSNIVYTESLATNQEALVEVRTAPDGTIVSRKLQKSSGIKSWDDAVLKAIDKTDVLPRDVDGRVPPVLEISFRPRD